MDTQSLLLYFQRSISMVMNDVTMQMSMSAPSAALAIERQMGAQMLVDALERVLMHGRKSKIIGTVSIWDLFSALEDCEWLVEHIHRADRDHDSKEQKARAFIQNLLHHKRLSECITVISEQEELLEDLYEEEAVLRRDDDTILFVQQVVGLENIPLVFDDEFMQPDQSQGPHKTISSPAPSSSIIKREPPFPATASPPLSRPQQHVAYKGEPLVISSSTKKKKALARVIDFGQTGLEPVAISKVPVKKKFAGIQSHTTSLPELPPHTVDITPVEPKPEVKALHSSIEVAEAPTVHLPEPVALVEPSPQAAQNPAPIASIDPLPTLPPQEPVIIKPDPIVVPKLVVAPTATPVHVEPVPAVVNPPKETSKPEIVKETAPIQAFTPPMQPRKESKAPKQPTQQPSILSSAIQQFAFSWDDEPAPQEPQQPEPPVAEVPEAPIVDDEPPIDAIDSQPADIVNQDGQSAEEEVSAICPPNESSERTSNQVADLRPSSPVLSPAPIEQKSNIHVELPQQLEQTKHQPEVQEQQKAQQHLPELANSPAPPTSPTPIAEVRTQVTPVVIAKKGKAKNKRVIQFD